MSRTVTDDELLKRINRRLMQDEEMIVRALGSSGYCRLDIHRNMVIEEDVDIEALARGLDEALSRPAGGCK